MSSCICVAASCGGLLCPSQTFGTRISLWVKVKRAYAYLKPDNKQTHTICSETLQWLQSCAVPCVCVCACVCAYLHLTTERTLNLTIVDAKILRKFHWCLLVQSSSDGQLVVPFKWHLKCFHTVCHKQPCMFHFRKKHHHFNFCSIRHWFIFFPQQSSRLLVLNDCFD